MWEGSGGVRFGELGLIVSKAGHEESSHLYCNNNSNKHMQQNTNRIAVGSRDFIEKVHRQRCVAGRQARKTEEVLREE